MRTTRALPTLLLVGLFATAVACKKDAREERKKTATNQPAGEFLNLIPDDTPYVMASFKPVEGTWIDEHGGVLSQLLAMAKKKIGTPRNEEDKVALALVTELEGKLSKDGFQELGLSATPQFAFYGLGPLPVLRLELSDGSKLIALINRVAKAGGETVPWKSRGDVKYLETDNREGALVAIHAKQLVFSVYPRHAASVVRDHVLDNKKPAASVADSKSLHAVVARHGFEGYLVGSIEFARILDGALGRNKGSSQVAWATVMQDDYVDDLPIACVDMVTELLSEAPRFVFGYDEVSDKKLAMSFTMETSKAWAAALSKTTAKIAGVSVPATESAAFAFGGAVHLKNVRELAVAAKPMIARLGKVCKERDFTELAANVSEPLPPGIADEVGYVLALTRPTFDIATQDFSNFGGYAIVQIGMTDMLLALAKTKSNDLVPDTLKNDGEFVQIPLPFAPKLPPLFASVKGDRFVLAFGTSGKSDVKKALSSLVVASPYMFLTYDATELVKALKQLPEGEVDRDIRPFWGAIMKKMEKYGRGAAELIAGPEGVRLKMSVGLL